MLIWKSMLYCTLMRIPDRRRRKPIELKEGWKIRLQYVSSFQWLLPTFDGVLHVDDVRRGRTASVVTTLQPRHVHIRHSIHARRLFAAVRRVETGEGSLCAVCEAVVLADVIRTDTVDVEVVHDAGRGVRRVGGQVHVLYSILNCEKYSGWYMYMYM